MPPEGSENALSFLSPHEAGFVPLSLPELADDMVQVRTRLSAVSMGTESFIFSGKLGQDHPLDSHFSRLTKSQWPVTYGYQNLGIIERVGKNIEPSLVGERVFAFKPHVTAYQAPLSEVIVLPHGIPDHKAVFYASLETAITIIWDLAPRLGERIGIYGLGTIGLITASILNQAGLYRLGCFEISPHRITHGQRLGLDVNPSDNSQNLFDAQVELTGRQSVLGQAVKRAAFEGRIVAASWYADEPTPVLLGTDFHRKRIDIKSSQVSTLGGAYASRLTSERRQEEVLHRLASLPDLQTIGVPFHEAIHSYDKLSKGTQSNQIILTYPEA